MTQPYIGRFAPSPSGPLHFGSLITAIGSYLQARAHQGLWLVRIEDLDPPREQPGAAVTILRQLAAFGMKPDRAIRYQSQQQTSYQSQIDTWLKCGQAYYCQCTRKQIQSVGGIYPGTCRRLNLSHQDCAIRLHSETQIQSYLDLCRGRITIPSELDQEDMIIRRRDGLYAYNLAVVLDDISQGITEVVRGADLIDPTGRQCTIYKMLGAKQPRYLHLPLALDEQGNKLSKQNHAQAIDESNSIRLIHHALAFLGHPVPRRWQHLLPEQLLSKMSQYWDIQRIPIKNAPITAEHFSFDDS